MSILRLLVRQIKNSKVSWIFIIFIILFWSFSLTSISILTIHGQNDDTDKLQEEILQASEKYVRLLAEKTKNSIDSPFGGKLTGYDLKKTLAVLIENLLNRVNRLEHKLDLILNKTIEKKSEIVLHKEAEIFNPKSAELQMASDLILGTNDLCQLTEEEKQKYPNCLMKISWMSKFWNTDPCYSQFNVDGTICSFRFYLSEVESYCPPLLNRTHLNDLPSTPPPPPKKKAKLKMNLTNLLELLSHANYKWIKQRIIRMYPQWISSLKKNGTRQFKKSRDKKNILIHLGLLSAKAGFHFQETADKGGPLGELVQWSDIITAFHILGHNLSITSEFEQLKGILEQFPNAESPCQLPLPVDMIVTDIVGLTQFKRIVKKGYGKFSCLLRIIDSFGTEAAFNNDQYALSHHLKTPWGLQNLNLQQFFTMFPHSPDNSFMGFIVEQNLNMSVIGNVSKKNQAVLYGKAETMWIGKEKYLSVLKKYVDIHATVFSQQSSLPKYILNHGILSGTDLHRLLLESKLFIGSGFPYEGPAPLEAIAQGCIFINPKFDPPHSSQNTKFFRNKPTSRALHSQHPYVNDFISSPHVITVDLDDQNALEMAIETALKSFDDNKVEPYIPYEFTPHGMLQRLNAYIERQDFCSLRKGKYWPPVTAIDTILASEGLSCKDACWKQNMICEPSHFKRVNSKEFLPKKKKVPTATLR